MPAETHTTTVTAVRELAPEVRELVLAAPAQPLDFRPGQWLSLHLPVGERPPLVRAYSLAAPPSPSGELVLCLDRVPDGLGSEYLFSLQPGDAVTYAAVLGNFVLQEGPADQLWMARYTGIVPFRAMLLALEARPPEARVTLLYGACRQEDLVYLEELERAAEAHPWFHLITTVDEEVEGWTGSNEAVLDLLPGLVGKRTDLIPMVCGKREFVRPIRDFFHARGYDRRAVKWESYD